MIWCRSKDDFTVKKIVIKIWMFKIFYTYFRMIWWIYKMMTQPLNSQHDWKCKYCYWPEKVWSVHLLTIVWCRYRCTGPIRTGQQAEYLDGGMRSPCSFLHPILKWNHYSNIKQRKYKTIEVPIWHSYSVSADAYGCRDRQHTYPLEFL